MEIVSTWTFEANNLSHDHWIRSAGRWDSQAEATKAAANFLLYALEKSADAYGVRVVMVDEYELGWPE